MAKLSTEKYLVLMVDDSEDDRLLIKVAMAKTDRLRFIGSVSDGEELVSYMTGKGQYEDRSRYPLPDMLLLDLKMPRKDGFEVLEWLRSQPFDNLVVVVLSGSSAPVDIRRAMELGASEYRAKPIGSRKQQELMRLLEQLLSRE